MKRWCGIDQQLVELDSEERCSICGTHLGPDWLESPVQTPHVPAKVEGNRVTEDIDDAR